jgi:hypothetical protein
MVCPQRSAIGAFITGVPADRIRRHEPTIDVRDRVTIDRYQP